MDLFVFSLFAGIAILAALGVIALPNPVYSALSLALVFVSLAALYIMLNAPFIAAAQVMIYAGAILILFLFVIMLLSPETESGTGALKSQRWLAGVFGAALVIELALVLGRSALPGVTGQYTPEYLAQTGDTQAVGAMLFTDFLLPFEITSLLLLVAVVGVVVLTKRARSRSQAQNERGDLKS